MILTVLKNTDLFVRQTSKNLRLKMVHSNKFLHKKPTYCGFTTDSVTAICVVLVQETAISIQVHERSTRFLKGCYLTHALLEFTYTVDILNLVRIKFGTLSVFTNISFLPQKNWYVFNLVQLPVYQIVPN